MVKSIRNVWCAACSAYCVLEARSQCSKINVMIGNVLLNSLFVLFFLFSSSFNQFGAIWRKKISFSPSLFRFACVARKKNPFNKFEECSILTVQFQFPYTRAHIFDFIRTKSLSGLHTLAHCIALFDYSAQSIILRLAHCKCIFALLLPRTCARTYINIYCRQGHTHTRLGLALHWLLSYSPLGHVQPVSQLGILKI